MKTWHKIAALSLASVCAYWLGQRSQRDELDQLRGSVRSVAQSLQDTDRAVAQQAAVRFRAAPADPSAPPAAAPSAPPPADPAPPASAAEPARPSIDPPTLRAHLGARFEAQTTDPAWSGTARLMIQSKLAAVLPSPSTLRSVECKETMCRIEMVYDDLAQYPAVLRRMTPEALPWNGTLFSSAISDPSAVPVTFVAFLSREGQELAVD